MSDASPPPAAGTIGWHDLTVADAEGVRDFYQAVVGWTPQAVDMGEYSDWTMLAADGSAAGGVCHARGPNTDIPPVWLVYVRVEDMDGSLRAVREGGGEVVVGARSLGGGRMAVIRDPAGAILALWEEAAGPRAG